MTATDAGASAPRPTLPLARIGEGRTGGSIVLARWADHVVAFVADEDEGAIRAVDVDAGVELSKTALQATPGQILVAADGRLLVALRDKAKLASFRATDDVTAPLVAAERTATSVEPIGVAESPDGQTFLVTTGWGHTLEGFAAASFERTFVVDVAREPRAVATSSDGATAFVVHASASQVTAVDLRTAPPTPSAINLTTQEWVGGDDTVDVRSRRARGAFSIARLDGDRERLFIPHVLVDPGDGHPARASEPSTGYGRQTNQSGTQAFEINTVDPKRRKLASQGRIPPETEDPRRGGQGACLLPRAAAIDPKHAELLVACLGVDEVRAWDAKKDDPLQSGVKPLRRWSTPGGPSGIAVDAEHDRAVVWSAFDAVVRVLSLARPVSATASTSEPLSIRLVRSKPERADVALGRKLFFSAGDPRIAKDGRACGSCHIDGRDDGLVWSSPMGPRQTMELAGRADHRAPFGWLGEHATPQLHISQTLKNLRGTGLEHGELAALAAWVGVMSGPPVSSHEPTPMESRGRAVFESAACASCHAEKDGFSDHVPHDVKSRGFGDRSAAFVTPALRFVSGTPPYFHDGRYDTLEALLTAGSGHMASLKGVAPEDVRALAAYLATL